MSATALETLGRYKKAVLALIIFVAYSVVVLWLYADARNRLEEDAFREVLLETEKQAAAVSYFFSERRNDLGDLAASSEVENFFANRDLGMSFDYGLGINAQAIEARFERHLLQKKLAGVPIYAGIALVDSDDKIITLVGKGDAQHLPKAVADGVDGLGTEVILEEDTGAIIFKAPVRIRNLFRGQVIAWGQFDINRHLLIEGGKQGSAVSVVMSSAHRTWPEGITSTPSAEQHEVLEGVLRDRDTHGAPDSGSHADPIVAVVRVGIENTPFSLIAPISTKHAGGRAMPRLFIILSGIVPLAVIAITFLDIFERKRSEELREAARHEAERLARLRSDFLANMSHEIRTPLNGVLGLAQIGYRDNIDHPEVLVVFTRILHSGKLLLGIVNDILDFSKIEAGKLPIEKLPVDLHGTIDSVGEMLAERAAERKLELRVEKSASLPRYCLADPIRLTQIMTNLLANSIKFTETGFVSLHAGCFNDLLKFRFSDTGIGMTPEQLGRLFSPFEQADSGTTRKYGGTGLGLAITWQLVELMGGTIQVESKINEGTTFLVCLPFLPATESGPAAPLPTVTSANRPRLAGIRILMAEDDEVNRLVLENMLSVEGAEVTIAENGKQAVEHFFNAASHDFDLVLMDIQMPEMDGYEAAREILRLAPDLPIISLTAHALAEDRERSRAAGMIDQLTKPIDCETLVATVLNARHGAA